MVKGETARNPKKLKPSHANAYEQRREACAVACAKGSVNKRAAYEAGLNTRQALISGTTWAAYKPTRQSSTNQLLA